MWLRMWLRQHGRQLLSMARPRGHSLLEAIVAASIFVVVAIFLTTIWALYDSALTKSATRLAANHVARSVAEGCMANGYDWLVANPTGTGALQLNRRIRSRSGQTTFEFQWEAQENNGSPQLIPDLSPQLMKLSVDVAWHSERGSDVGGGNNNRVTYTAWLYRGAQR